MPNSRCARCEHDTSPTTDDGHHLWREWTLRRLLCERFRHERDVRTTKGNTATVRVLGHQAR